MKKIAVIGLLTVVGIIARTPSAFAGNLPPDFQVVPFESNDTLNLVRSTWEKGTGCPNTTQDPTYQCRMDSSDTDDNLNQGLLLGKSGNGVLDPGQAGATLVGVQGQVIPDLVTSILGYDIRKDVFFGSNGSSIVGSHYGDPDPQLEPRDRLVSRFKWARIRISFLAGKWLASSNSVPPRRVGPGCAGRRPPFSTQPPVLPL